MKHRIKSFVRREGRLTAGQKRALNELWPQYGIELPEGQINFNDYFPQQGPLTLEIGFGNGQSLLAMAQDNPQTNFVGIEVHRPGVGSLLKAIAEQQITNLRLICTDAVEVLQQHVADNSIDCIQIFFPDPWPKKRHHKRRLIQDEFVNLLTKKLKRNGELRLATDWQDYAEQMVSVLSKAQCNFAPHKQQRQQTKFEKRGKAYR